MNRTILTAIVALGAFLQLAGCSTVRATFPSHPPEQVWTALKAAAETPVYDDWVLKTNEVWVSEEELRIEIYRKLDRLLHRPGAKPLREDRTWRFRVTLVSSDPPEARFVSRGMAVPAHALQEGDRYFDLVWQVLGGQPEESAAERKDSQDDENDVDKSGAARSTGPADLYDGTR